MTEDSAAAAHLAGVAASEHADSDALPVSAWPAAIVAQVVGNACPMMQPLLVGLYVDRMGFGVSAAGYISAGELGGLAVTAILTARRANRGSLARVGAAACVLFGVANLASIFAASLWTLVLTRIATGCAAGAALAVGSALAARTRMPERTFALAFAGITLYGLLFFLSAARLIEDFGPAGLYGAKAALAALATVVIVSSPLRPQFGSEARMDSRRAPATRVSFASLDDKWKVVACGFLLYVGHGAIWTYEERMGVRAGLSAAEIGHAFGLASIAGLTGALIAAGTGTRLGRLIPQLIALGLSIVAALLVIVSDGVPSFTIAACLIAVTWFYGVPYLAGVAAALDPAGRLAGVLSAVMSAGFAVGPFLAATLVSGSFAAVGWLAGGAYLLCTVLVVGPARRTSLAEVR